MNGEKAVMRCKIFVASLFCISLVFAEDDFAPIRVGNEWVYSYYYKLWISGNGHLRIDSITETVKITGMNSSGNDTALYVQIIQNGICKETGPGYIAPDSIISKMFIDTVRISGDSIYKSSNYRCHVFPFWKRHGIGQDSLKNGSIGGGAVKYFKHDTIGIQWQENCIYIQNVGMYNYFYSHSHCALSYTTSISLLAFNGTTVPFSVSVSVKNKPGSPGYHASRPNKPSVVINNNKMIANRLFDLKGRKIEGAMKVPSGIFFNR